MPNASPSAPSGESPQKGSGGGFNRLRPVRGLPIASPTLLSVRDVARRLKVSSAVVYRLCERGELLHHRVSNAIRIAVADVDAFLSRNREGKK